MLKLSRRNPLGSTAGIWKIPHLFDGNLLVLQGQPVRLQEDGCWETEPWCWVITTETNTGAAYDWLSASRLDGQRFSTRREALLALESALLLSVS